MSQVISVTNVSGFASEFAALQLENEQNQAQSARMQRDAARETYLDQAQQQVDALHAAADATRTGAFISASLTIAGGACQIVGASLEIKPNVNLKGKCITDLAANTRAATILGDAGSNAIKLADPLKGIVGDSTAAHRQADAKQHETLAAQAQWRASDASAEIDKAEKRADKTLDMVQEIQRDQNTATNALIGRI